jgi:hypothetical protein
MILFFTIYKYQAHVISQLTSDMERLQEEIQAQLVRPSNFVAPKIWKVNAFSSLDHVIALLHKYSVDMDWLGAGAWWLGWMWDCSFWCQALSWSSGDYNHAGTNLFISLLTPLQVKLLHFLLSMTNLTELILYPWLNFSKQLSCILAPCAWPMLLGISSCLSPLLPQHAACAHFKTKLYKKDLVDC